MDVLEPEAFIAIKPSIFPQKASPSFLTLTLWLEATFKKNIQLQSVVPFLT